MVGNANMGMGVPQPAYPLSPSPFYHHRHNLSTSSAPPSIADGKDVKEEQATFV